MRECGEKESVVAREELLMLMEIFIRGNGQMIWLMGKGYLWILQVLSTLELGLMICSMVLEKKAGIVQRQDIKDCFIRGRRMGKEDSSGKMVAFMRVTL